MTPLKNPLLQLSKSRKRKLRKNHQLATKFLMSLLIKKRKQLKILKCRLKIQHQHLRPKKNRNQNKLQKLIQKSETFKSLNPKNKIPIRLQIMPS